MKKTRKQRIAQAQALIRAEQYRYISEITNQSFELDGSAEVTMDGDAATVRITGVIDSFWGVDCAQITKDLDEAKPSSINLLITSPGGFLQEAIGLYSDLRSRARDGVTVRSEARGLVASAAVMPYLAGNERIAYDESAVMIHDPFTWGLVVGTAEEIEADAARIANALRSGKQQMVNAYVSRTGNSKEEVEQALSDETFMNGQEIVDAGYATALVNDTPADPDDKVENLAELRERTVAILTTFNRSMMAS